MKYADIFLKALVTAIKKGECPIAEFKQGTPMNDATLRLATHGITPPTSDSDLKKAKRWYYEIVESYGDAEAVVESVSNAFIKELTSSNETLQNIILFIDRFTCVFYL